MSNRVCCVVNCKNTSRKNQCKFYKFPVAKWKLNQTNKWIAAVRRENIDGSPWYPKPHDYICSDHFVGGKKSEEESSPSYVPTIFPSIYKTTKVNESSALSRHNRFMERRIKTKLLPTATASNTGNTEARNKRRLKRDAFPTQKLPQREVDHSRKRNRAEKSQGNRTAKARKRSQPDKAGELSTKRNPKQFKSKPSTSQSEQATQNATQENSSHIEQVYIKEEPIDADPNDSSLYQELRDSIKTELDNSENDSTNSDTEKHIDSISTDKEHFVNVKKECSDSFENEISVNPEIVKTEQTTTFESVFVKQEPFEED